MNSHFSIGAQALPAPRKAPRQARAVATVDAILDAAARVFVRDGYADTTTNLVAETAGVSIGSLYQYFPNKDALIVALHRRHSAQMHAVMTAALDGARHATLRDSLAALTRALLAAHLIEPELHRMLERQFSFFDEPKDLAGPYAMVVARVRALLEQHRDELVPANLDLATYIVLRTQEALVHAAVLEPPTGATLSELEAAITDVLVGYLAGRRVPA